MNMRESVLLPFILATAGIALGLFLDWLRNRHPAWFGFGKTCDTDRDTKKDAPEEAKVPPPEEIRPAVSLRPPDSSQTRETETDGECPLCGGLRLYDSGQLALLVEDAYGRLYECPRCRKHWYYDHVYAKWHLADDDWIHSMWPDLSTRRKD